MAENFDVLKYADLPAFGLSNTSYVSGTFASFTVTSGSSVTSAPGSPNTYLHWSVTSQESQYIPVVQNSSPSDVAKAIVKANSLATQEWSLSANGAEVFLISPKSKPVPYLITGTTGVTLSAITQTNSHTSLQLTGIEALKNVMKMYLLSEIGDYGRDLTKGGPLYEMVGKPLNEENRQKITTKVTKALEQFTNITINTIEVTLDLMDKMFVVRLTFTDNYNKYYSGMSLGVQSV